MLRKKIKSFFQKIWNLDKKRGPLPDTAPFLRTCLPKFVIAWPVINGLCTTSRLGTEGMLL